MSLWVKSGHFRRVQPMSALPPKADIDGYGRDVRFVPKADISGYSFANASPPSFGTARLVGAV